MASLTRPPVLSVLLQHQEEAAFCWLRRQGGLWSPAFKAEHVRRFDLLLDAHLEGLRVAEPAILGPSFEAFAQWKTPDEAFVSTYVLAHAPDTDAQADLEALLLANPDAAPGAAAALLWSTPEVAAPLLRTWEGHAEGLFRRIALPARLREVQDNPALLLHQAAQDPATQARAFRALGEFRLTTPLLQTGISHPDPALRLEAVLALALIGDTSALDRLPELFPALKPSAQRRALMAWGALAPDLLFQPWMSSPDPEGLRLRLWAAAFRGDGAWISFLAEATSSPETAQLAAYALGHLTGMDVDLDALDLDTPEEAPDASETEDPQESEHPEDTGLLEPDPQKVQDWLSKNGHRFSSGKRTLAGLPLEEASQVLATGWQPQRWQAAFLLARQGQTEPLRTLPAPSLKPYTPAPTITSPPLQEDWKAAMMRGIRAEEARKAKQGR